MRNDVDLAALNDNDGQVRDTVSLVTKRPLRMLQDCRRQCARLHESERMGVVRRCRGGRVHHGASDLSTDESTHETADDGAHQCPFLFVVDRIHEQEERFLRRNAETAVSALTDIVGSAQFQKRRRHHRIPPSNFRHPSYQTTRRWHKFRGPCRRSLRAGAPQLDPTWEPTPQSPRQ